MTSSIPSESNSRHIVNDVSSPGSIGLEPTGEEYDGLPFKLPMGPYSHTKPNLPYAALIGQAILASPEHRLTLQEIYDFITIVYPYFKRNEQKWMTSMRRVLSTNIVFRKVQRDRAAGRALWAIFDRDLDCFVGGGFRKEFCADMQEQKEKARRKRSAEDTPARKSRRKKRKTQAPQEQMVSTLHPQMGTTMSTLSAVVYPGPTLFPGPPIRPGPHHQPYYTPTPYVMPQLHVVPSGVIFPLLPPGSVYNLAATEPPAPTRLVPRHSPSPSAVCETNTEPGESPSPSLPPTSSSPLSLPELTPNNSSSSPPETTDEYDPAAQGTETYRASASVSPEFDMVALEEAPLDSLALGTTLLNPKPTAGENEASKSKGKEKKGEENAAENVSYKVSYIDSALMIDLIRHVEAFSPPCTRIACPNLSDRATANSKSETVDTAA